MVIIFSDFLLFGQIFFSQEVKRSVITNNKHGIYELLGQLSNGLRLRILQNQEILGRSQGSQNYSLAFLPKQKFCHYSRKTFDKQNLKVSRSVLFHMKTRACLNFSNHDILWKHLLSFILSQTPVNLNYLAIQETLRQFYSKIKATNL